MRTLVRAIAGVTLLCLSNPALALDVDGMLCVCADDARSHGDYVSCVAHFSRRLVAAGTIGVDERARLLRDAAHSQVPDAAPDPRCDARVRYGVGAQANRQVHAPGATARIEGLLWNLSAEDATALGSGGGSSDGEDSCLFVITLADEAGAVVHRRSAGCPRAVTEYPLQAGRIRRFAVDLPLVHLSSDAGLSDGTLLTPGLYVARVEAAARYPHRVADVGGLRPAASVAISVED